MFCWYFSIFVGTCAHWMMAKIGLHVLQFLVSLKNLSGPPRSGQCGQWQICPSKLVSFLVKRSWSIRMVIEIIKIAIVPTKRCGFNMTWLSQPIKTIDLWGKNRLNKYPLWNNIYNMYMCKYIYISLHYSQSRAQQHATVPRRAARTSAPAVGFSLPGEIGSSDHRNVRTKRKLLEDHPTERNWWIIW